MMYLKVASEVKELSFIIEIQDGELKVHATDFFFIEG